MFPYQQTQKWISTRTTFASKAIFNRMNYEGNVQRIKDSDKWIKNGPYSALWLWLWYLSAIGFPFSHHAKHYATSQDLFVCANHHLIGQISTHYLYWQYKTRQSHPKVKWELAAWCRSHKCTVLHSTALTLQIIFKYRQYNLMWKMITWSRCFCSSSLKHCDHCKLRLHSMLNLWTLSKHSPRAKGGKGGIEM